MKKMIVIGNLGADAKVREENGRNFVTFRVADTERFTRSDGTNVENTTWVSCVLTGDGGNLFKYLVKGQRVYVEGDISLRVFSSAKTRRMEAGVSLSVRRIELLGSPSSESVPSTLITNDGEVVPILKFYHVNNAEILNTTLHDRRGALYSVDEQGWVLPLVSKEDVNPAQDKFSQDENEPTNETI